MSESLASKYLDSAMLGRLMAQPLLTRLAMQGTVSGLHRSPHKGSSVEFSQYRNYSPGDDLRRLDWRVFARSDRFYLKEFEAETNLRCHLVLDGSGSMAFAFKNNPSKFDYARRLVAAFAYLLVHQGDAAGLTIASHRPPPEIPPKRTPSHIQLMLESIDKATAEGETLITKELHAMADRIRPRAMVVVISDFFCDLHELVGAVQHLRFKKHDVVLLQLLDRQEVEFKFDHPVRFQDLESSTSLVTEPQLIRDEYLRQIGLFQESLRQKASAMSVDLRTFMTDESMEKAASGLLLARAQLATAG